jgi:choline dehydrogenase-like flavoprotein
MPGSTAEAAAAQATCDVLVVGGGINGVGIARDLAGRGLRVVLCERDDLAAHTSSASTKATLNKSPARSITRTDSVLPSLPPGTPCKYPVGYGVNTFGYFNLLI